MFGLMTVKAHEAAIRKVKAHAAIDITAEQRRNERLAAEIAALRPDAEWARARKAKAAEYEASKRVRKAKGAA